MIRWRPSVLLLACALVAAAAAVAAAAEDAVEAAPVKPTKKKRLDAKMTPEELKVHNAEVRRKFHAEKAGELHSVQDAFFNETQLQEFEVTERNILRKKDDGTVVVVLVTPDGCDEMRKATLGDHIHVHYVGSLGAFGNGTVFDSSRRMGRQPFRFILGSKRHPGFDYAIEGMCVGERRALISPPASHGKEKPKLSTTEALNMTNFFHFDLELTYAGEEEAPPTQVDIFATMDVNKDGEVTQEETRMWFAARGLMPVEADHLFTRADANKDGIMTKHEHEIRAQQALQHIQEQEQKKAFEADQAVQKAKYEKQQAAKKRKAAKTTPEDTAEMGEQKVTFKRRDWDGVSGKMRYFFQVQLVRYYRTLPIPDTIGGFGSLSVEEWMQLAAPVVAVTFFVTGMFLLLSDDPAPPRTAAHAPRRAEAAAEATTGDAGEGVKDGKAAGKAKKNGAKPKTEKTGKGGATLRRRKKAAKRAD